MKQSNGDLHEEVLVRASGQLAMARNACWIETQIPPPAKLHEAKLTAPLDRAGLLCVNVPYATELVLKEGLQWLKDAMGATNITVRWLKKSG